jgi:hypothetical protein
MLATARDHVAGGIAVVIEFEPLFWTFIFLVDFAGGAVRCDAVARVVDKQCGDVRVTLEGASEIQIAWDGRRDKEGVENGRGIYWIYPPELVGFRVRDGPGIDQSFENDCRDFRMAAGANEKWRGADGLGDKRDGLAWKSGSAELVKGLHIANERLDIGRAVVGVESLVAQDEDIEALIEEETIVLVGVRHAGGIAIADKDDAMVCFGGKQPAGETVVGRVSDGDDFGMIVVSGWIDRTRSESTAGGFGVEEDLSGATGKEHWCKRAEEDVKPRMDTNEHQ